jgi:regulator of RNase E activity RraA
MRGIAGTIVDGCATDFLEIQEFAFPVYARSITALTTKGLAEDGEINTQVQIGGVTVNPGDLVVADSDGILIMSPEMAQVLVKDAEARQKRGAWAQEELLKGTKISELSGSAAKIQARLA